MSTPTRRGRRKRRQGQLHRGALRSNAGPNRLRRKTADRPAKLSRLTPARAADAAPGAVDSLALHTAATDEPDRHSRPAAVRGPSLTGLINNAVVDALGGRP